MEPNYFTCTLGQASELGIQQPHKTVNEFVDALAKDRPHDAAVAFPVPGKSQDDEWSSLIFSFGDIKQGVQHVASLLQHEHSKTLAQRQTVGLLCPSTPEFLFTWLALMRLGHALLLIAPQCQPAAISSLCKTCGVSLLLFDDLYQSQAQGASRPANEEDGRRLDVSRLPFPDKSDRATFLRGNDSISGAALVAVDQNDVAYLHHTSGTSSGMPKPIPQTNHAGIGVLPSFKKGREVATFTTTPLYHGGIADLFRAWTSGALIWLFPGKRVPITASNITKCLNLASTAKERDGMPPVKYFSSVPYILQMMEADARGMQHLQNMDIVGVGGAALPDEVGDRLVQKGVNLISRFGSAECGFLMSSHRDYAKDDAWQYLRSDTGADQLSFESASDGLHELVIKSGWPHMAKRNREDGSYATSDLFAPHPTIPNAWRYHSRADSQLTLITGKKFDPAPLEAAIASSEVLDDALIFGTGRPFPGVLLFRSRNAASLSDKELLAELWPTIEKLNLESQDHARIPKSMVIPMALLGTPLEKSSKGTLLRGVVEKRFQQDIENSYDKLDHTDGTDVSDEELPQTILDVVNTVVRKSVKLTQTTDLYSYGVDSVAGMQIRYQIRRLLPADAPKLPINVVEDCGSVERLAQYLLRIRHGEVETESSAEGSEHAYMWELVQQYSHFTEVPSSEVVTNGIGDIHGDGREVVVLTGATGALGAHILHQYRLREDVSRIYCLVRGADAHASFERVNKALVQRKLQPLEARGNESKVVILQAQLGEPGLGLDKTLYDRIAGEATIVMHVAWSVNFRMKLRSFVKDNIAGVRNLINLALASSKAQSPRFAFCSSVASMMAYDGATVPEVSGSDPSTATELGYSQSKWVAEQICLRANDDTRLHGRMSIYRVGQLAGDRQHGVWNMKEAWPMMLSAMKVTGSLPALDDEVLNWLPVDIAAEALIQGVDNNSINGELAVFHIVNEHKEPCWADLLRWLKKHESFEITRPSDWVRQLEEVGGAGSSHPSLQLLDHWKKTLVTKEHHGEDSRAGKLGPKQFAMARTKEALPTLRNVEPVSEQYAGKLWSWIRENV